MDKPITFQHILNLLGILAVLGAITFVIYLIYSWGYQDAEMKHAREELAKSYQELDASIHYYPYIDTLIP